MSQNLFFRFLGPERVEWCIENSPPQQASPDEFARRAAGHRLILVVAGERVTLTQAKVQGRSRATWLKALPYTLEEGLAEDVEDLHFAVGKTTAGMETPVAVVSHHAMRDWLDSCAQAGIAPVAVVPDILLLPYEEGSWSLLLEQDRALLRNGVHNGFAVERESLMLWLGSALTEAADGAPRALRVWGGEDPEIAHLGVEIRYQDSHLAPLQVFATAYDSYSTLNLLQGPYSRKAHLGKWLRPWRTAAVLACSWLAVQLAGQLYEYGRLARQQASLRAEMDRVYREAVPDARKVVNPKVQLDNRLRELRQNSIGSEAVFLDLLYRGGQPLIAVPGVTLRGMRYKDDQLDLDLESESLENLDQLKQRFSEQPQLNAELRTTKREGRIESQVSLKRASS